MKPIGPIPPHFTAGPDGQLTIEGQAAEELVSEAGGTPLFVYDNNVVGGQIARFRAAMPSGVALYYAVTANPYDELLRFVGRYVDGFRIVSGGELERLGRAGLESLPISFAGPGKRDEELEAAVAAGATISIESEGEAGRAIRAGEKLGVQPRLAVRVGIEAGLFGIEPGRAPSIIAGILEAGADWRGLHIFTDAQSLDAATVIGGHQAAIRCAGDIATRVGSPLPELVLGGGFGVPCFAGEQPLDFDSVAKALGQDFCDAADALATTRFAIELGRWLVAEAGVYLTRIVERKESGGRTFLITDGGGHHLLGATGPFAEPPRRNFPLALASRFGSPADEDVTVTGCLCTPFDVLGDEVRLPRAEPGDLVALFCAGAYGLSASPQGVESRPSARELLV